MKEIVITSNEKGQRLDRFLRKYLKSMSLSAIYKLIRTKEITVNGSKSSEKYMLSDGDVVKMDFKVDEVKKEINTDFLNIEYDIKPAYEDENLLIVQKPSNKLVHPDEGNDITLTEEVMAYLYDKGAYDPYKEMTFTPSPCNRLDRNTEGLVIFAKNYEALKAVNQLIRDDDIKKYYSTIVKGRIEDKTYSAYILKNPKTNRVTIYKEKVIGSKEILMNVTTIDSTGQFSQLEIELITGRSHQIRAHLAYLSNPIIGDTKYGDKKTNSFFENKYLLKNQLLVAYKLIFKNCPVSLSEMEGKTVIMPLPGIFKKIKNDIFKF